MKDNGEEATLLPNNRMACPFDILFKIEYLGSITLILKISLYV
jgi:hypothetical protein